MWCPACQQDVPGLAGQSPGVLRCGRCGQQVTVRIDRVGGADASATSTASAKENLRTPTSTTERRDVRDERSGTDTSDFIASWSAIDRQLREAAWILNNSRPDASRQGRHAESSGVTRRQRATSSGSKRRKRIHRQVGYQPRNPVASTLGWVAISIGTASFACGVVLMGWSYFAGRGELWSLGVPIMLAGQVGLLIGLVLALDRLWSDSRQTAKQIADIDEALHEVRTAIARLGTSYNSGSQAFYLHMAEGAQPKVLLADLKGQLDLLAERLSREER